jgi:diketogulonate reductase-like aldo/keto reductase
LFITTKLWHDDKGDLEGTLKGSMERLGLEYLDLYLIHWMRPVIDFTDENNWKVTTPPLHKMWADLERLVKAGTLRNIGVSNCTIPLLLDLLSYAEIPPACN